MADAPVLPKRRRKRRRRSDTATAAAESVPPSIRDLSQRSHDLFRSIDRHIAVIKATIIALGQAEVVIQRLRDVTAIAREAASDDRRRSLAQEYEVLRRELDAIAASQGIDPPTEISDGIPHSVAPQPGQIDCTLDRLDQRLAAIQSAAGPLIGQFLLLQIRRATAMAGMELCGPQLAASAFPPKVFRI